MKNPNNQTQAQRPELPQINIRETAKTLGVIAVLVLAFTNFNLVIDLMVNILIFIYQFVGHSFGIAIILLTVLIRLITWPLNAQQMKGAKAMQELQNDKEWLAIQKKYAKDREKLAQEQMRIYRERNINVFGSCLPTLIQFPILFALIPSITYAIGSYPLSILKLSKSLDAFGLQDVVSLIPLNSKFLGIDMGLPEKTLIFGVGVPLLAITVALTTFIQTKLTMPPTANPNDQSAATTKMMSIYMPIMLFMFSLNYAAGLSVYFVASNILSIVQYAMMGKVNWRNLLPGGNKS